MTDAGYGFLPWVRRGLSALARTAPTQNFVGMQVALSVNKVAPAAPVAVRLHGPGQVTGIDPRAIVRTEPRPDTSTFEANYFPAIEFARPDFPWMFTPALPNAATLTPWICLVVVREQAGIALVHRANALSVLQFSAPAVPLDELPNLDQIAVWAHAQIVGAAVASGEAVSGALDGEPTARISRIVCPRKLEAGTSYLACLVPTYHVAVRAGVSPELPVDDGDLAPAWDANVTAPFTLPVYYSWRFSTSTDGDFVSLARKLRPPPGPLQLGLRPMDVSAPGFGMPQFPGFALDLEGALQSRGTVSSPWPAGVKTQLEHALAPILSPAASVVPIVAPPVYGEVPASLTAFPAAGAPPIWLRELNLDPRSRAVAGFGTEIVRADQESLMASAWEQFEAIRLANQLLRHLQLARAVTRTTLARHLAAVDGPGTFLQLTQPLHARVRVDASSALTLHGQVALSRIAPGAMSAAFRRLSRRRGPIGRQLFVIGAPPSRIVERLNATATTGGGLMLLTPRLPPSGAVLLDSVSAQTSAADLTPSAVAIAKGWTVVSATGSAPQSGGGGVGAIQKVLPPSFWATLSATNVPDAPAFPDDATVYAEMEARFRAAATSVAAYVSVRTALIDDAPDKPQLATTLTLAQTLTLSAVDPDATLVARGRAQLALPTTGDPLRPLLVSPQFPRPMSRALTPQQLLPGVERVPSETAALLVTNRRFVEAFMVGLNDEMRRELAWRQYPADQRGTYFTNFWGATPGGTPRGDIEPIASWNPTNHLGANATAQGEQIVLLLRGELLRRYPTTIISAVKAKLGPNNVRTLSTTERFPIFRGSIDPDMVFFGFALSAATATAGEGWYFVLAEHPSEPRFGLRAAVSSGTLAQWNDLAWPQIAVAHQHVNIAVPPSATTLEGATWGANSAHQAFITFRRPVRLALHATALIA